MGGAQPPRRLQERPVSVAALVARVLVDIPALDREFDYLVPDKLAPAVRVGTIVRVTLHGRRVRGWVAARRRHPARGCPAPADCEGHRLGPAVRTDRAGRLGGVALGRAAHALHARRRRRRAPSVRCPPAAAARPVAAAVADPLTEEALSCERAVLRLPPGADRFPVVEAAVPAGLRW